MLGQYSRCDEGDCHRPRTAVLQPQQATVNMIRYDTIRKKSLTYTQKLSDQLNLAHVATKKYEKRN